MDGCQQPFRAAKTQTTNSSHRECTLQAPDTDASSKDQKITIEINNGLPQTGKTADTQAVTLVDGQKFTIKIDSDTDWPSVTATFAVGVAIAWFAYNTQKSQIRSSAANFRHTWQNDLRSNLAQFMSKIFLIHANIRKDPDFFSKPESDKLYSEILLVQATVELMLDSTKNYTKELTRLMEETIQTAKKTPDKLNYVVHELNKKANEVLELAWQDIRKDLGLRKKKVRSS